jgi:WD40 repeat protein
LRSLPPPLYALSPHPDGSLCLVGGQASTLSLVDLRTGRAALSLTGHTATLLSCAFEAGGGGCVAASSSIDNTGACVQFR